jgi:hypothetical protein
MTDTIVIASSSLQATFATRDGSLINLVTVDGAWPILEGEGLGLGFSLLVPLDGRRNNPVDSRAQEPPVWSVAEDGTSAVAEWARVQSEHGGDHEIGVRMSVSADGDRLVLSLEIANHSDLVVEDCDWVSMEVIWNMKCYPFLIQLDLNPEVTQARLNWLQPILYIEHVQPILILKVISSVNITKIIIIQQAIKRTTTSMI